MIQTAVKPLVNTYELSFTVNGRVCTETYAYCEVHAEDARKSRFNDSVVEVAAGVPGDQCKHCRRRNAVRPEVGQGITEYWYSDRHVGTIIDVNKSGKTITIQEDKAIITKPGVFHVGGFAAHCSQDPEYRYEANPEGRVFTARLADDGNYYTEGGKRRGHLVIVGERHYKYDYNF